MNSNPHRFEDLQDRLLKLEKQNHRFKQLGVAALIVAASLVVMGQASHKKTVEANEFILRGEQVATVSGFLTVGLSPMHKATSIAVRIDREEM